MSIPEQYLPSIRSASCGGRLCPRRLRKPFRVAAALWFTYKTDAALADVSRRSGNTTLAANTPYPPRHTASWVNRPLASAVQRVLLVGSLLAAGQVNVALAGGGPENVLLVVNSNSDSSRAIANEYIRLRNIPASNVVYIDWQGPLEECGAIAFRDKILAPALSAIRDRNLAAQIDYVVYSSDFPWRVGLKPMFPNEEFAATFKPYCSLNGATFLWHYFQEANPSLVLPIVNWYLASGGNDNDVRCQKLDNVTSRGFHSRYLWDREGKRTEDPTQGQNYLLSTMLGVTAGRGNTEAEIISYLRRSAGADGSRPHGTIYFMKNNDIRSGPRHDCYAGIAQQLTAMAVSARVEQGTIPLKATAVAGIMTGTTDFDFAASKSRIVPGAICEHLTSLGGVLSEGTGQTPLTEFLRYGAAGASGTVIEPLALQAKFPLPSLQLHYARGCSLAESFYQSVACPYQLLIVGDPLCQPWAAISKVTLMGVKPGDEVKGNFTVQSLVTAAPGHRVGSLELFTDGHIVARFAPGTSLDLDTTKLPDGYHELRIVAIDADQIETQGRMILPIFVNNHGAKIAFSVTPSPQASAGDKLRISLRQPGATAIIVRQNEREVARLKGESGDVEVSAGMLGRGPVTLQAQSEGNEPAISAPARLDIH
jgi:uncharacterized protein (TIGR03790 family)